MFTVLAFFLVAMVSWGVERRQENDGDVIATNIKHSRQDLRLIAYLLYVVILLLGIIADRIH